MYGNNNDEKKFNLDGNLDLLKSKPVEEKKEPFDKTKEKRTGAYRFFRRDATIAIFIFALLEAAYSIDEIISDLQAGFSGEYFNVIVQVLVLVISVITTFGLVISLYNITSGSKNLDYNKFTKGFNIFRILLYGYVVSSIIQSLFNLNEILIYQDMRVTIVNSLIILGNVFLIFAVLMPATKFVKKFLNAFHAESIDYPTYIPFKSKFVIYFVYSLITSIALTVIYTDILLADEPGLVGIVQGVLIFTFALVAVINLLIYNYMNSYEKHFSYFNRKLADMEKEAVYEEGDIYIARHDRGDDEWHLK